MNKVITIYVKGSDYGKEYNPCFKYNSVDEYKDALMSKVNAPKDSDTVIDAMIDDNYVTSGECSFLSLREMLELVLVED